MNEVCSSIWAGFSILSLPRERPLWLTFISLTGLVSCSLFTMFCKKISSHPAATGGVNDMAAWTARCWPNVINALSTGEPLQLCFEEQLRESTPPALTRDRSVHRKALQKALRPHASRLSYDIRRTECVSSLILHVAISTDYWIALARFLPTLAWTRP